ncbi:MAG: tRNA guanosine(34) transglycosylase Tgt [Deltaproteobacteria bacterium]|nr:tRNA guanosine(34) transglycosylase Tgt [Deltaproteobacteria bacterium]
MRLYSPDPELSVEKHNSRLLHTRLPFTVQKEASGSRARAATMQTLHGEVHTPIFMPVGTQATVKAQTVDTLKATGARILLANTYHLLLRPGPEVFQRFGGIHRFMHWDGPVLTDSGGFQIFSLPRSRTMNEDGACFQSYVDGTSHLLSPESSIAMQRTIGSDIIMALDQCIPSTAAYTEAEEAMLLTHRWAERSLQARGDSSQALFGIIQGACHPALRKQSATVLRELPFDGLAIGGLAVGETHQERYDMTALVTEYLPTTLPRYLMGVGTPIDILESVHRGVDMFDCIMPTQLAQRGVVFTSHGKLKLHRSVYKLAEEPLDAQCECQTCQHYSRAYLHHLIKASEALGWHLLGQHNLAFYHRLMREIRDSILRDDFLAYYEKQRLALVRTDEEHPGHPPKKTAPTRPERLGDYEMHRSAQGFSSIRQISSGEVMHSVIAPDDEANKLYVEQSCLAARLLKQPALADELVIWDVGLGAAFNAMATIHCFERCYAERGETALRRLRLVSIERDLDPLLLAAKLPGPFTHLRHGAPFKLLKTGKWEHASSLLHWELLKEDFRDCIEAASIPDLIFYDLFSANTHSTLWTIEIFTRIFQHCVAKSVELYTYSASTAVRVALLAAGFFVAEGIGSGPKSATTLAFTRATGAEEHPLSPRLLDQHWLARWHRSHVKFPATLPIAEHAHFEQLIENHPQFKQSGRSLTLAFPPSGNNMT